MDIWIIYKFLVAHLIFLASAKTFSHEVTMNNESNGSKLKLL